MSILLFGPKTELPQMLAGREARALHQQELLDVRPDAVLVCFTVNAPGKIKLNAVTEIVFGAGLAEITRALESFEVTYREVRRRSFGHEAFFALCGAAAREIKAALTSIEETHPLGRFFDIDVIYRADGIMTKISRADIGHGARSCLLCSRPAAECASTRAHSTEKLCEKMRQMVCAYARDCGTIKDIVRALSYSSMLAEVATTPKPGLVDAANNGSHADMNPELFAKSAEAIEDYFAGCYESGERIAAKSRSGRCESAGGIDDGGCDEREILDEIRPQGIAAEKRMLRATAGVNTHKGLIFSLGIICSAWGYESAINNNAGFDAERVLARAGQIAGPTLDDFNIGDADTPGRRQYKKYGLTGIRGEAAAGFPALFSRALPTYEEAAGAGLSPNEAGMLTLLRLISCMEDSNMISRGGRGLASEMSIMAGRLADTWKPGMCADELAAEAGKLDEIFIGNNLSPGGCADMLAITYFIEMAKALFAPKPAAKESGVI